MRRVGEGAPSKFLGLLEYALITNQDRVQRKGIGDVQRIPLKLSSTERQHDARSSVGQRVPQRIPHANALRVRTSCTYRSAGLPATSHRAAEVDTPSRRSMEAPGRDHRDSCVL